MTNNFTRLSNVPNLMTTLRTTQDDLLYNKLNCMRVAIVEEFYPETKKVKVNIVNKATIGLNKDGTQIVKEYPPIFAKVVYLGWGDIGATFPLVKGMEGFLLFNDREIESWFLNGQINPVAYNRCHSLSDAVFICGIQSQPNLVEFIDNCLNLFYKQGSIQIADGTVTINGNTTINGNLVVNGSITATGDIVSGEISLQNHVHGNGNDGQDTTKAK